jgi:hypothetical protein
VARLFLALSVGEKCRTKYYQAAGLKAKHSLEDGYSSIQDLCHNNFGLAVMRGKVICTAADAGVGTLGRSDVLGEGALIKALSFRFRRKKAILRDMLVVMTLKVHVYLVAILTGTPEGVIGN